jgi:type I restriction enzyme M protein
MKNPHTKTELVHEEPAALIARMREHEKEVVRLLGEIEALVQGIKP